jgi:hypothetical protein
MIFFISCSPVNFLLRRLQRRQRFDIGSHRGAILGADGTSLLFRIPQWLVNIAYLQKSAPSKIRARMFINIK